MKHYLNEICAMTPDQKEIFNRYNSLGSAIKNNDLEWAHVYMEYVKDQSGAPTREDFTTLFFKTLDGMEKETADFLIANGADIDKGFDVHLPDRIELVRLSRMLIDSGNDELFKYFVESGHIPLDDLSVGGDTLLAQALAKENVELAEWLFDRGANIDAANFLGFTALHRAALNVSFIAVEWLLSKGANPELQTMEYNSVPSQVIPTVDDTGDNDLLFDILEDYSVSYNEGSPSVPEALTKKTAEIRQEQAKKNSVSRKMR